MPVAAPPKTLTVALIGNPNTGKSTLFSALAGVRQRVGNYPGVTVEKKLGYAEFHGQAFTIVEARRRSTSCCASSMPATWSAIFTCSARSSSWDCPPSWPST
jgi:ribosome-binding ATPase YchF (GTP1/OBG family)